MIRAGLEDRDPETPPCDSLAEAMALSYLRWFPHRLDNIDLTPLLVFPEHRQIYAAMKRVYRPDESVARFQVRLIDACEQQQRGLSTVLDDCGTDYARWYMARVSDGHLPPTSSLDIDWFVARLERVAESRRLIESAQRIAERAWRGDVDGAAYAAATAARVGSAPPVWERDAL